MPSHYRIRYAATVLALSVGVAACGGSTSSAKSATATTAAGKKAVGEPIKLGSIVEVTSTVFPSPEVVAAHKAWARYMNDQEGGIGGRPIEIIDCDDHGDPARDAQCARDLISQGVLAFIDNTAITLASNGLPLIEQAAIPAIGGTPVSNAEYNSKFNFPIIGGGAGSYPSLVKFFGQNGAKSVVIVRNPTAAAKGAADLAAKLFTQNDGGEKADQVEFNPADPDFVPALTAAAKKNADAMVIATGAATAPRLLQAAQVAGNKAKVGLPGAANTPVVFNAAGPAVEGVYFTTGFIPTGAGDADTDRVAGILKQYDPSLDVREKVQNSVAGLELLKTLAERTIQDKGQLTSANLLTTLNAVQSERLLMGPTWSPSNAPAGLAKVWNSANIIVQYKGGKVVKVSDFVSGLK